GEKHAEWHGDEDVGARELEALDEGVPERWVVPDRVDRIAPVPAGGEGVPDRPRARGVEGELHCDEHRDDRPDDVGPGDDHEEAGLSPRVAQPATQASGGREAGRRPLLGDGGHSAPTAPTSRWARWMLHK